MASRRDDALLRDAATPSAGAFSRLGLAFLTVNSAKAVHRSKGDPAAVGFVAFSYLDLLLLYHCHRRFESAAPGSPARRRLKVAVWVLTTMLTAVLSYKVAAIMPLPVQVLVWAMAGAAVGGGFYAFFMFREGKNITVVLHPSPAPRRNFNASLKQDGYGSVVKI